MFTLLEGNSRCLFHFEGFPVTLSFLGHFFACSKSHLISSFVPYVLMLFSGSSPHDPSFGLEYLLLLIM